MHRHLLIVSRIDEMAPKEKRLIFSQSVRFLNLIEPEITEAGYRTVRINGPMSEKKRLDAMTSFINDDEFRFILCSIQAAGVGINLTRGNVCSCHSAAAVATLGVCALLNILLLRYSASMDRVHRLGQTRPIRVIRFVIAEPVEETDQVSKE
jgi:SNF2 family DNA or RNA helicase